MIYAIIVHGVAIDVATKRNLGDLTTECRMDWETFERAEEVAAQLKKATNRHFIPIDSGASVWPRYDVIEVPRVGDKVSYGFNGDSYPDGTIVSISASLKVIRTENSVYYRRKQTGTWLRDGTWSLRPGHVYEQNPSF